MASINHDSRLPALTNMRKYPFEKQVDITITAFSSCLHNFIRMNQEYEDGFDHVQFEQEYEESLPPNACS